MTLLDPARQGPLYPELLLLVLQLVQPVVVPMLGQQLIVPAFFDQSSLVQNEDAVHMPDGEQAMRDDDACPTLHQALEGFLNQRLSFRVHTRRRFVEHE